MLGDRIYELRKNMGLSQVDHALKMDKIKQSISNWENNNILPSIDMLIRLSEFFHVSCDYLLGLEARDYLEVTGLTRDQLSHIQLIIDDIRK